MNQTSHKHSKLLNYYGQDCLKKFRLHFRSLIMTQISTNNSLQLAQNKNQWKSTTICDWKFSDINFWPKPDVQNSAYKNVIKFETFPSLFFYISIKHPKNYVSRCCCLKKTGMSCKQKVTSSDNPGQNICKKQGSQAKLDKPQNFDNLILCKFWPLGPKV